MTATSTEHRTESSCAFLNRPPLRFRKVLQFRKRQLCSRLNLHWLSRRIERSDGFAAITIVGTGHARSLEARIERRGFLTQSDSYRP